MMRQSTTEAAIVVVHAVIHGVTVAMLVLPLGSAFLAPQYVDLYLHVSVHFKLF